LPAQTKKKKKIPPARSAAAITPPTIKPMVKRLLPDEFVAGGLSEGEFSIVPFGSGVPIVGVLLL